MRSFSSEDAMMNDAVDPMSDAIMYCDAEAETT